MERLVFTSLLLVCLAFCVKSGDARLMDDVESYIQTRPDSALSVLRQIDTASLKRPKDRAHFALLQAIALDKNYIDTTDLRVIRPAVAYYQKYGTASQKMQAYYYEGRILHNAQRDAEAVISLMHALENATNTEPDRYLGLIYSEMANLSARSYCWEEAEIYLAGARQAFLAAHDTTSYYWATKNLMTNRFNQGRITEALELADSLMNQDIPASLQADVLIRKAEILVDTARVDYHPALECYLQAFQKGGKPLQVQLARYAYTLGRCGYEKEADQVFQQLLESEGKGAGSAKVYMQELLAAKGDYQKAYQILRESLDSQSETVNQLINQSLFRAQRDYIRAQEDEVILRNKNQRLAIILLVLSLALAAICSVILIRHFRHKAMKKELEMERFEASMKQILEEKDHSISGFESKFKHIHSQRFKQLEEYYKDYETARRSGASDSKLYESLLGIIRDIEGDNIGQRHFDILIDQQYDGVMTRLRTECPHLQKHDYLLFSYTAAGFDWTTIAMLLGNLSADAVHTRRYRLRKTLREINPPSLEAFLGILDLKRPELETTSH